MLPESFFFYLLLLTAIRLSELQNTPKYQTQVDWRGEGDILHINFVEKKFCNKISLWSWAKNNYSIKVISCQYNYWNLFNTFW